MADDAGWIKLQRSLLDGPIIQHAGMLQVWIYCLLRANWEPRKVMFAGSLAPIAVDRGEFVTGRNALHAALYPHDDKDNPVARTVWRWLEALESMECVKLRTVSNRCTVVTICKYKTYQADKAGQCPTDVPPVSNPCPADVPPVSTDKELNNQRKTTRGKSVFVKPTVAEVVEYCHERNNGISGQEFFDKCESVGWVVGKNRTPMRDWKAAIRTWEQYRTKNPQPPTGPASRLPTPEEDANWNPYADQDR